MLTIIEIQDNGQRSHSVQSQSHRTECWLEGWTAVPEHLVERVYACGGYCDLVMTGDVLTDIVEGQRPPKPPTEPSETEKLRSDMDYLSMMTGVELPGEGGI